MCLRLHVKGRFLCTLLGAAGSVVGLSVATASLIENWIDESERRVWFPNETTRAQRD